MPDSNELRTIKKCSPKLETALNGVESKLVHFLHEEGFITDALRDEILEPKSLLSEADKASKLVKWIRKSVELDAPKYNILLDWFKAGGPFYKAIVNILHTEYERGTRLAGELKKDKRKKKQLTAQQGIEQKTREEEGLIKELQREIALLTDNVTKDEHIRRLQTEKHQLQLQLATQEGHQQGTLESQVQDSRLRETQQREELQRKDVEISRLREEGRKDPQPREETGQVGGIEEDKVSDHQNPSSSVKLTWRQGESAPENMTSSHGSAVVHGNTVYFSHLYNVYSYTVPGNKWTKLPPCKYQYFALAVINNIVTCIGGQHDGWFGTKVTNLLLNLIGNTWKEVYPPMPTKRSHPAATSIPTHLVVVGGSISEVDSEVDSLATVEVLNTDTLQWSTARRLPGSARYPQLTLCDGRFYLRSSKIFSCSVEELLKSCKPTSTNSSDGGSVWTRLAQIPVQYSTLATLRGRVLAIGGSIQARGGLEYVNLIHSYDVATNSWSAIDETLPPLSHALAAVLPSNELVLVHGEYTGIAS